MNLVFAPAHHRFVGKAMGTAASLHIADFISDSLADEIWGIVSNSLLEFEVKFSTFIPSSEISRINSGDLHLLDASAEVIEVLDLCTWLEHRSNGVFNAYRQNGLLDPAGLVKGWATEKSSRLLSGFGLRNWYLGLGGDIQTAGRQPDGSLWTFGVMDPIDSEKVRLQVEIPINCAIATSGNSQQGAHIRDSVGNLISSKNSFTVIGPSLTWADAFATIGFAMGDSGADWVGQFEGYAAISLR